MPNKEEEKWRQFLLTEDPIICSSCNQATLVWFECSGCDMPICSDKCATLTGDGDLYCSHCHPTVVTKS